MLKDQPKWKKLRNQQLLWGQDRKKKSNSEAKGGKNESVGMGERLEDGGKTRGEESCKEKAQRKGEQHRH